MFRSCLVTLALLTLVLPIKTYAQVDVTDYQSVKKLSGQWSLQDQGLITYTEEKSWQKQEGDYVLQFFKTTMSESATYSIVGNDEHGRRLFLHFQGAEPEEYGFDFRFEGEGQARLTADNGSELELTRFTGVTDHTDYDGIASLVGLWVFDFVPGDFDTELRWEFSGEVSNVYDDGEYKNTFYKVKVFYSSGEHFDELGVREYTVIGTSEEKNLLIHTQPNSSEEEITMAFSSFKFRSSDRFTGVSPQGQIVSGDRVDQETAIEPVKSWPQRGDTVYFCLRDGGSVQAIALEIGQGKMKIEFTEHHVANPLSFGISTTPGKVMWANSGSIAELRSLCD